MKHIINQEQANDEDEKEWAWQRARDTVVDCVEAGEGFCVFSNATDSEGIEWLHQHYCGSLRANINLEEFFRFVLCPLEKYTISFYSENTKCFSDGDLLLANAHEIHVNFEEKTIEVCFPDLTESSSEATENSLEKKD